MPRLGLTLKAKRLLLTLVTPITEVVIVAIHVRVGAIKQRMDQQKMGIREYTSAHSVQTPSNQDTTGRDTKQHSI